MCPYDNKKCSERTIYGDRARKITEGGPVCKLFRTSCERAHK